MATRRVRSPGTVVLNDALLHAWLLPLPTGDGDKEDRGNVLVIGGPSQLPGAVILAAVAALRAGAGKLTIATSERVAPMVAQAVVESRVVGLTETGDGSFTRASARRLPRDCSAVLIGPGMESTSQNSTFVTAVLERSGDSKVVLDAGAMDVIGARWKGGSKASGAIRAGTKSFSSPILITPHAGELAHLTGRDKAMILRDPETAVLDAARRASVVVTLKGAVTLIATPDGRLWRHECANIGLATSGSGDVLAGLIAGFAARGATIEQASAWGVSLHAHAGEALVARVGTVGYLAREIAGEVPTIMQALLAKGRGSRRPAVKGSRAARDKRGGAP